MIKFPQRPHTHDLYDIERGRFAVVEEDYHVAMDDGREIVIQHRYVTDYASIPRAFRWLFLPRGRYSPAALAHDWLYGAKRLVDNGKRRPCTRAEADRIFLDLMALLGVSWATRRTMWIAVRAGGWISWKKETLRWLSADGTEIIRMSEL